MAQPYLIITPMLLGQSLHPEVIKGVARQGNFPWLISTQSNQLEIYCTEAEINLNRHKLQQEALKLEWDYMVLLDSDVVLPEGAIEAMRAGLTPDLVAVAMDTKDCPQDHILMACALMRRGEFERLRYLDGEIWECACKKIARLGKVAYLEGIRAREVTR